MTAWPRYSTFLVVGMIGLVAFLPGCGQIQDLLDAGIKTADAGTTADSGVSEDAGNTAADSGPADAGLADAGLPDAGAPDAGPGDAGVSGGTCTMDLEPNRSMNVGGTSGSCTGRIYYGSSFGFWGVTCSPNDSIRSSYACTCFGATGSDPNPTYTGDSTICDTEEALNAGFKAHCYCN